MAGPMNKPPRPGPGPGMGMGPGPGPGAFPPRPPMGPGPMGPPPGGPPMQPGPMQPGPPATPAAGPGPGPMPGPAPEPPAPEAPIANSQLFVDRQVSYHGPQEVCGSCDYFQPPTACILVAGPKDEAGWCMLHSARGGGVLGGPTPGPEPAGGPPGEEVML